MQALSLARQRLRQRIQSPSSPKPVRLAHGLVENGQTRFLPVLSSALAQDILSRGYDAFTLDRIYANRPCGDLGMVGKLADRTVLALPAHQALRERLNAAAGEMVAAAVMARRSGEAEIRILGAPCGLAAELLRVAERLRAEHPEAFHVLRCWAVDADPTGAALPEAERRARAQGAPIRFIREDLRRRREVAAVARREGPFHVISCLGITERRPLEEVAEIVRAYSEMLAAGGTLLLDRWEAAEKSEWTIGSGLQMTHLSSHQLRAVLGSAGLTVEREHATGEGGCALMVARKVA